MSKIPRIEFLALLAVLLVPAAVLGAGCGICNRYYYCVNSTSMVMCIDGIEPHEFTCAQATPVCTTDGCVAVGVALPDCEEDDVTIPSITSTPAITDTTPSTIITSSEPANTSTDSSETTPDSLEPTPDSTESTPDSTESTPTNSTSTASPTTTTTPAAPFDAKAYCLDAKKSGYSAIPNDTACISYVQCYQRANVWNGSLLFCPESKPYYNAKLKCGTVKPTNPGCL